MGTSVGGAECARTPACSESGCGCGCQSPWPSIDPLDGHCSRKTRTQQEQRTLGLRFSEPGDVLEGDGPRPYMGLMSNESNFSKKRASTRHAPQIIPTRSRRLGYVIPPKHTIGVLVAPTPLDRSPPLAAVTSAFSLTVASGK